MPGRRLRREALAGVFALAGAALLTGLVLWFSYYYGRLILFPLYDDCGYLAEGARWVQRAREHSWRVLSQYPTDVPHSPYATFLAAASFGICGIHDWAPYLASGWIVLAALLWTVRATRGEEWPQRLALLVLAMTVPLLGVAVHEYRPDAAFGLICAWGYFTLLGLPRGRSAFWLNIAGGLLFGAALLIKPAAFPLVACLWLTGCLAAAWIRDEPPTTYGRRARTTLGIALQSGAALVLVSGWHFWFAGRRTVEYVLANYTGAMRDVWTRHDDWRGMLRYYLDGPECPLGRHIYLLAPIAALGLVLAFRYGAARQRRAAVAVALGLAVAYLVPTIGRANNPYFAQTFQYGVFFAAVLSLRHLLLVLRRCRVRPALLFAPCGVAAVIGLGLFQWPTQVGERDADWIRYRREIVAGIFELVAQHSRPPQPRTVFLTTIGDVNPDTMNYLSVRADRAITWLSNERESNVEVMLAACKRADFVVASESGTRLQADFLASYRIQDEVLRAMSAAEEYREIGYFEYRPAGRGFHVFARVP